MIPITRKELYLNKIVGNDDYSVPEKPISEEEFFFAEILGEAVQAPEPLTRYQMYLAKIAGREIEIPYPEVRLEYFLARAAGMEIEAPTPITREEMFWADYALIVEKELSGIPPLTFNAVAGTLKNYRIYGNTVNGENVGDLITEGEHAGEYSVPVTVEGKNLLQNMATSQTINGVTFTVNSDSSVTCNGTATATTLFTVNAILTSPVGEVILTGSPTGGSFYSSYYLYVQTDNISPQKFYVDIGNGVTINNTSANIVYSSRIVIEKGYSINNQTFYPMLRLASIADDTYEPYHAPVTTPIYLPEQLRMVGTEADYIDYGEQKMHRIGADDIDVTLPALPTITGTNVLSVGTAVQPSKVYVKYKGERQ